jgi:predicted acylesterase/phospholipase RssA/CRP-like cAMP-binding protein
MPSWPDARQIIQSFPLLSFASADVVDEICGGRWCVLPADELLWRVNAPAKSAYFVIAGRLDVLDPSRGENVDERVIAQVERGGIVGELALLVDAPRSASVRARRDTVLLEVPRKLFVKLAHTHPEFTLALAARIAGRLADATGTEARKTRRRSSTLITIAPIDVGLETKPLAQEILKSLSKYVSAREISAANIREALGEGALDAAPGTEMGARLSQWLLEAEEKADVLLLVADHSLSEWTNCCLRQADVVLLAARGGIAAPRNALADKLRERPSTAADRRELVVVHSMDVSSPRGTRRLLDAFPLTVHYHVRMGNHADFLRLARRLTQRGVALSLSGGAARGIAHLGVFRSLQNLGIPVDHISGTSMGSLFGAFLAAEFDIDDISRAARKFAETWFLDPTLPVVSALSGEHLSKFLKEHFGERTIEDLWLPYIAVASRLDNACPHPIRRGFVSDAVRASASVPGLYAPVPHDGTLLVDGLFSENLPVRRAHDEVLGYTIAVNVIPPAASPSWTALASSPSVLQRAWSMVKPRAQTRIPPILELVMYSFFLPTVRDAQELANWVDCYIEPAVGHINFLDGFSGDECIQLGQKAADESLEAWLTNDPEVAKIVQSNRKSV